jgi:hypothetical protein
MHYPPIEDHGIIGDLNTVALVGLDGTIGFMCAPRFDSPTVFGSLLDAEKGGSFSIAPALEGARSRQLYLPDTNVLLTRFMAPAGVAEITDFMPVGDAEVRRVVRRAKAVRGEIRFQVRCAPRFGYGRTPHTAEATEEGVCFATDDGSLRMRLDASVPLEIVGGDAVAEITLKAGETAIFVLEVGGECKGAGARVAAVRRAHVQGDGELLAALDRPLHLHRPLARRGQPLRARAEAARLASARLAGGGAHLWAPRTDGRRAQLGLPLHLGARRRRSRCMR